MPQQSPRLDETDLRIVDLLLTDARTSHRALARAIGMSPPAIAERVARLEADGVITGYRAVVDLEALGRGMTVIVSVVSERSADQRDLAHSLLEIPEVESVDVVTGPVDLRLRLRVRDQAHFRQVYFDRLMALPGVRHTESSLVMAVAEPESHARTVVAELLSGDA